MILWRISNYADLAGTGGLKTAGRWHNRGVPIVYLAESPALALLEVLVNFELDLAEVPTNYQLLEVEYGQRRSISRLHPKALPEGWEDDVTRTRAIGDEWLMKGATALLRVPSAVVPRSFNYLFNPRHPDAALAKVKGVIQHPYDRRLLKS